MQTEVKGKGKQLSDELSPMSCQSDETSQKGELELKAVF